MKSGSTADVRRPCAEFLDFASAFYEVPSCSLRVLAARALRGRENWASELFGDDAEFLDAFEASLTNKERREFGLPCVNRQKKDRAADYDNRLPDLMAFVQRYYFNHCKNDAKMALQLWQEDVEVITARMTELVNSKKRGKKTPSSRKTGSRCRLTLSTGGVSTLNGRRQPWTTSATTKVAALPHHQKAFPSKQTPNPVRPLLPVLFLWKPPELLLCKGIKMLHECSPVGAAPHIGSRRYMDGFMLHTGGVAGGSGQPPPLCRSTSCFVGPAARQKNVAYKAKRRRSRTKLAVRTSPGRTIRIAAAPVSKRDHAEYAVRIIVRARCKEELVVCAVRAAILAELQCPNLIDLDSFAIRVAKRTDELTRFRIERVDPASGSVVADQNRVAHRAEISGSQRDAPGRMERAIGREVFHQITLGIKNVHKATLRFVQGGVRHPNVAIDGLNSIWRKTSRDSRVAKRLRQTKCAIKDAILRLGPSSAAYRKVCPALFVAMAKPV